MSYGRWLVFFSSLPAKPGGNRVKVWRKLQKAGAVQFKGAVYLLPATDEHAEFFQWLVAEIDGMGGEAAFARVERVEPVPDAEIAALFERRKAGEYRALGEALDGAERKIDNLRQGGKASASREIAGRLARVRKEFAEARRTDFFPTASGRELEARIARAQAALGELAGGAAGRPPAAEIPARSADGYRGRLWVTRPGPFVDRMASAWLIRRFIDPAAAFGFVTERETVPAADGTVGFDLAGGEFTHVGDLCTFEVLLRAFGLRDAALDEIAAIVHDLDLNDGLPRAAEAAGLAAILAGARRAAADDADALERGIAVFELLCAAKRR